MEMLSHIWNPWHGCKKYSEGCAHCYMYYLDAQRDRDGSVIYKVKSNFDLPLKKTKDGAYRIPSGATVHVCLTSDFFLEEADEWREEAWLIIKNRPDLRFWLQTKRAERVLQCLPRDWGEAYRHVSICFTAENQKRADERLPILAELPFAEKHVMCAPMLSEITLEKWLRTGQIGKVLADGENYDGDRVLRYEWVKKLYDECVACGVEFDFVGTGNYFYKDGKTYRVPKAYQHVMALRSGLQFPPRNADVPVRKKCAGCPRNASCGGCKQCGKCR